MNATEKRKETGAVRRAVGLVKLGVVGGLAALVLLMGVAWVAGRAGRAGIWPGLGWLGADGWRQVGWGPLF